MYGWLKVLGGVWDMEGCGVWGVGQMWEEWRFIGSVYFECDDRIIKHGCDACGVTSPWGWPLL